MQLGHLTPDRDILSVSASRPVFVALIFSNLYVVWGRKEKTCQYDIKYPFLCQSSSKQTAYIMVTNTRQYVRTVMLVCRRVLSVLWVVGFRLPAECQVVKWWWNKLSHSTVRIVPTKKRPNTVCRIRPICSRISVESYGYIMQLLFFLLWQ